MPNGNSYRYAASSIAVMLGVTVIIVVIASIGIYGMTLTSTVSTSTSEQTTTLSTTQADCILEIPNGTTMTPFSNFSLAGTFVNYPNGTSVFFDASICPQPLSPQVYAVAYRVVTDPRFIAEENGVTFLPATSYNLLSGGSSSGKNGTTTHYLYLTFVEYSNPPNPLVQSCNGTRLPNSYITLHYYEVAELDVRIPNSNFSYYTPLPSDINSLNFSATTYSIDTALDMLDGFYCTATTSTSG
jgi:hypothetical protein